MHGKGGLVPVEQAQGVEGDEEGGAFVEGDRQPEGDGAAEHGQRERDDRADRQRQVLRRGIRGSGTGMSFRLFLKFRVDLFDDGLRAVRDAQQEGQRRDAVPRQQQHLRLSPFSLFRLSFGVAFESHCKSAICDCKHLRKYTPMYQTPSLAPKCYLLSSREEYSRHMGGVCDVA